MKKCFLAVLVFLTMFVSISLVLADGSGDLWEKFDQLKTWLGVTVVFDIVSLFCIAALCHVFRQARQEHSESMRAQLENMRSQERIYMENMRKIFFLVFDTYPLTSDEGLQKLIRDKVNQEQDPAKKVIMAFLAQETLVLPRGDKAADEFENLLKQETVQQNDQN